jgi:hypothetical protein
MQRPHEEKASKLTLRYLVFRSYLQEVSRGHSKLRYEPGKKPEGSQQTKDRMLELGKNIEELIKAKRKKEKAETRPGAMNRDADQSVSIRELLT